MEGAENHSYEHGEPPRGTLTHRETSCIVGHGSCRPLSYQENAGRMWSIVSSLGGIYILLVFIVAIALNITAVFGGEEEFSDALNEGQQMNFTLFLTGVAALSVVILVVLAVCGKLTKTDHYFDRQKTSFVRGGMVALGTGALLYNCIVLAEEIWKKQECWNIFVLIREPLRNIFIVGEVAFLYAFTRIRINRRPIIAMLGRIVVSHLVVTNMCMWMIIVLTETLHELEESTHESDEQGSSHALANDQGTTMMTATDVTVRWNNSSKCETFGFLSSLSPYLFPLTIEYSVLVCSMWLNVWENCGICFTVPQNENEQIPLQIKETPRQVMHITSGQDVTTEDLTHGSKASVEREESSHMEKKSGYKNSGVGFILGWLTIVMSLFCVLVFMYWKLSNSAAYSDSSAITLAYVPNAMTSAITALAIPIITFQMHGLSNRVEEHASASKSPDEYSQSMGHDLDQRLLKTTASAALIFKTLSIIAALETSRALIAVDGVVSILTVLLQTGFIVTYVSRKMCTTDYQRKQKPGRQGLEFIRCANFGLWVINTFLLKDNGVKAIHSEVFGKTAWVIMSNLFQPLTILYYFHSMICVADVIAEVYSAKNIASAKPSASEDSP